MYVVIYSMSVSIDLRIAFDLLDRNQDGKITANELQFMLKNLGINVRDELIDDLIKEASHSGKHIISVDNYIRATVHIGHNSVKEMQTPELEHMFSTPIP